MSADIEEFTYQEFIDAVGKVVEIEFRHSVLAGILKFVWQDAKAKEIHVAIELDEPSFRIVHCAIVVVRFRNPTQAFGVLTIQSDSWREGTRQCT